MVVKQKRRVVPISVSPILFPLRDTYALCPRCHSYNFTIPSFHVIMFSYPDSRHPFPLKSHYKRMPSKTSITVCLPRHIPHDHVHPAESNPNQSLSLEKYPIIHDLGLLMTCRSNRLPSFCACNARCRSSTSITPVPGCRGAPPPEPLP